MSHSMAKPNKLRSGWASSPSLISLRCSHEETLGPELPIQHSEDADQTGQMSRLILVFAGHTGQIFVFVFHDAAQ